MYQKLEEVEARYQELNSMLADPTITSDPDQLRTISREHAQIGQVVQTFQTYKLTQEQLEMSKMMLTSEDDPEIKEMARQEITDLESSLVRLEEELQKLLAAT